MPISAGHPGRPAMLPCMAFSRITAIDQTEWSATLATKSYNHRTKTMLTLRRVEYAHQRKMRERNTNLYRVAHWPIWIFVFFLAPGPLVFDLFAGRGNRWNILWLIVVLIGTVVAAVGGRLPGAEPGPYILRFTEDRPNPLYRRVCYTFGWNAALNFAFMNLLGLIIAVVTGHWYMQQIYAHVYTPILALFVLLGAAGVLPRVRRSTKGEGWERRYFYGTVWAVTVAQTILLILWKTLPRSHATDVTEIVVYCAVLLTVGLAAALGLLPRTRPILPGESIVAD
jgi:hypothetical protein